MNWQARGRMASIVVVLVVVLSSAGTTFGCPPWGEGRTHECGRERGDRDGYHRRCGHGDHDGPVVLKRGVIEVRLPAAGGSVYAYLLDQEIVVFIDSGEFSFDADQVDGIEVDARATIAKGILGEYDVDIYLDFWSPDPTLPLTFKGGAGTAGITTDGKADVDGGSGSITATFGSGRVDVDAGSGALFLGLGSGRSDVKTGAGGGEITGQSGGWGTIYVTHRDRVLLDLGPDYDVQYSRSRPSRWDDCRR